MNNSMIVLESKYFDFQVYSKMNYKKLNIIMGVIFLPRLSFLNHYLTNNRYIL